MAIGQAFLNRDLFTRYQRIEQALVQSLMEMVINGVSTRQVRQITEVLCGTEFSKTLVSSLCDLLDLVINGWNNHSLEGSYLFLLGEQVKAIRHAPDFMTPADCFKIF